MIHYSVNLIGNPRDPSKSKKAHARVQVNDVFDVQHLAEHIAKHNSKYNEGDIYAVLDAVGRHVKELILMGFKVNLGKLGAFYPAISSDGADSIGEFTSDNIRSLHAKWEPSKELAEMKEAAHFEQVITHASHRALMKAHSKREREQQLREQAAQASTNE